MNPASSSTAGAPLVPQQPGTAAGGGADVMRALVIAAHSDYEALALEEFVRGGFAHRSELVTSLARLRQLLEPAGVGDVWDIVLLIDTPDGPPAAQVLETLARHLADTPVIVVGRNAAL